MNFYKKVLVLKEISQGFSLTGKEICGIARMESESGIFTLHLSFINISALNGGRYYAFLKCGKSKTYSFDLGTRPISFRTVITDALDYAHGVSIGLFFIKDDLPVMIAFSCTEDSSCSLSDLKRTVIEKCMENRKGSDGKPPKPSPVKPPLSPLPNPNPNTCPPDEFKGYNDEVVATENYYENDVDFAEKLKFIERFDNDSIHDENAMPSCFCQEEKEKNSAHTCGFKNETDAVKSQIYSTDNPYYLTVKKHLDELFFKFPEEDALVKIVPESKWVKISYSQSKYYVVGLVSEAKTEKYICYGVPATYSPTPPETLKGYCSFVPRSIFDLTGEGYWMMFQDAVTGECVKAQKC